MLPPDPFAALRRETDADRAAGAAFILETRRPEPTATVARVARDRLGAGCAVEPLFPGPDPTFFLARLPGVRFSDIPESPYDWAYAVRDRDDFFRSVEPDTTFYFRRAPRAEGPESAEGMCFLPDDDGRTLPVNWSLEAIGAPAAWALPLPEGGAAMGAGVRVAHLDTGRAVHQALPDEAFDHEGEYDFIEDTASAVDPLEYTWSSGLYPEHPGHGTATGSAIAGRGDGAAMVRGAAPRARLVSHRCARSVIISTTAATVARAIVHAADAGCHVISMSLGGLPRRALREAVGYAVSNDLIVCAAAGNCVRYVVAPAIYDDCVAVAGVNREGRPWFGSCSGSEVDVSAPGEFVWVATRKPDDTRPDDSHLSAMRPGQGTSFAVANVAGAAACWLAYHGRDRLLARYAGTRSLQHVFMELLRATAVAHRGPDWDEANFGPGILNVRDLLAAPLPAPGGPETISVRRDRTYAELLDRLGAPVPIGLEAVGGVEPYGAELIDLLYRSGPRRALVGPESVAPDDLAETARVLGSAKLRRAAGV